jgi:hypothetical protein
MKRIIYKLLILTGFYNLLILILPGSLTAQPVSFTAEAPRVVRSNEQFQLNYTLNENVSDFTPPDFGEFRYLGGPSQGSSTSINIVNGRTTRISSFTFTYYIQAPSEAGKYTVPPATATYKRQTVSSNPLEIEVIATDKPATQTGSQNQVVPATQSSSETTASGEDIFVRLEFDKRTAYVGEQITAWVKLYVNPQINISGYDQQFKGPEFTGFFRQDVELPPLASLEREKVGDDIYHTGVLRKLVLFPQKSGEVYVEPFDLLVEVQQLTRSRPQSIFDEFFGSQYQRKRIELKSNRVKLNIQPLPGNQPDDFSGAVGSFTMSARVMSSEVKTNDAVTFKVDVNGKGNIKLIDKLGTNFPPTFDVFDPVKKTQLDAGSEGRSGRVSFEYTAIPRHAGIYDIPPFKLVYFDPALKEYKTLSTQSFSINVIKGEDDSTTLVAGDLSKKTIELLGSDIRYIEPDTRLKSRNRFIFGTLWYFEIFITCLLVFIGILILRREQLKQSVDRAKYRNRKAGKVVSRRLKKASLMLKENNITAYYEELERALWGYLADKLTIPASELSAEKARSELNARELPEEISKEFISIIDACQYARYAPGGMESEMADLFERSKKIIGKLDQKI